MEVSGLLRSYDMPTAPRYTQRNTSNLQRNEKDINIGAAQPLFDGHIAHLCSHHSKMLHSKLKRSLNDRLRLRLIINQLTLQPLLQQCIGGGAVLQFDRIDKLREQIHRRLHSGSAQIPLPEGD